MAALASFITLRHSGGTKAWGAGVIRLDPVSAHPLCQYVSVWGPVGNVTGHKEQQPEFAGPAGSRFEKAIANKIDHGYYIHAEGVLMARMHDIAKGLTSPSSAPVAGCGFCAIRSVFSGKLPTEFATEKCSLCLKSALSHNYDHSHGLAKCVQFSMQPERWTKYISYPTMQVKGTQGAAVSAAEDPVAQGCAMCLHRFTDGTNPFWKTLCLCGLTAGQHVLLRHPHPRGRTHVTVKCDSFIAEIPIDMTPEPQGETAPVLADLPCNCRHHLNAHGPVDTHECLVSGCGCTYYRRTCGECGVVTRTQWRHAANCKTGFSERLTAEPINNVNPLEPVLIRRQRNIGEHLSNDWL